jgi:hypothetical protein
MEMRELTLILASAYEELSIHSASSKSVIAVIQSQRMTVLVQQYGQHIHLACGSTARFRHPHVRVAGRQKVCVGI